MVPLVGVPETIRRGLAPYREVFCRAEGFDHGSRYVTGLLLSPNKTLQGLYDAPTIPGGRYNPVNTGLSGLSFRKHLCNNTPLAETMCGLPVGGDHGACCTQRTQASLC